MRNSLLILFAFILLSCGEEQINESNFIKIPENIIDIPFYSITNLSFDKNILVIELIDSTPFYNPTVFSQALTWYSFQISSTGNVPKFDSLRLNHSMPIRDSIPDIHSNQVAKDYLNQMHEGLDNTILGDFQNEFYKLNWNTKSKYKSQQTSILDRVNSLFTRNIDTSSYKAHFSNIDTWFGIDCFLVFEIYFLECREQRKSIGHQIVDQIQNSTEYFDQADKIELLALINKYSKAFRKNNTAPNS